MATCGRCCPILPAGRRASAVASYISRAVRRSSSERWKQRQMRDQYAQTAKVKDLKSRAAYKLLQMDEKYRLFKPSHTVVDLGYAPGSWSQVAVARTQPGGRVLGVDLLPAQPPRGVSAIQGDFLAPDVRATVLDFVRDPKLGRAQPPGSTRPDCTVDTPQAIKPQQQDDRGLDILLSDMCEPWAQTSGFHSRTVSDPYRRLMNTSGIALRDHAVSMDLCLAALSFGFDTLCVGGHFVCKFYQGGEDKRFEQRLKALFEKVHREKPDASRSESKECYFVAIRRKGSVEREDVLGEN